MRNKLMAVALWVFVATALLGAQQVQAQDPRVTNISITATPSSADRIPSEPFARTTNTYTEILGREVTSLNLSVAVADVNQAIVRQSVSGRNTDLWDTGRFQNPFTRSRNINIPLTSNVDFMQITVVINRYVPNLGRYPTVATYTIDIYRPIWCEDENFDPDITVSTVYADSDSVPQWADIDKDDDGLIEICDLEGLDKVRYALDGSGYRDNESAGKLTSGCASGGCNGYELVRHLDFLDDDSYRSTANKVSYTEGVGWRPISSASFIRFDGNRYTIANLRINGPGDDNIGLFGSIHALDIRNIGLVNVDITGGQYVGGIAGRIGVTIGGERNDCNHCYVVGGTIRGTNFVGGLIGGSGEPSFTNYTNVTVIGTNRVGGIVGIVNSVIADTNFSYAAGTVTGRDRVGGFVGSADSFTNAKRYHDNYSTARVAGDNNVGGFVGFTDESVTFENNYWDVDTSGQRRSVGEGRGAITSLSTVQMLAPTAPGTTVTEAYYNWDTANWDFGTDKQYPALKYTTANTVLGQSVGELLPFQRNKLQSLMLKANGAGDDLISNFSPHRTEYVVQPAMKPNTVTLELTADEPTNIVDVVDAEGTIILRGVGDVYTVPVDTAAEETLIQVSVRNPSDPIDWFETQYSVRVMSTISGELSELEIEIEEGTTQTFDVAAEDKRYALEVGYAVESIKLTPRAAAGARISLIVGDTTTQVVVSGEAQTIPLPLGETTLIRIEVEGSVESTTYLLSVLRSTAAVLSELALSVGDLDFAAEVDAYTVAVANTVTSVAVTAATALDSQAMVAIYRGTDRVSLGTPVELAEGATTELRIEVVLGDLMRTYTVSVMRAPSANADLAEGDGLVLTGATLKPDFAPPHTDYTASVVAVDSVVVSAKVAHSSATIVVRKDSTEVEADNSGDYVIDLTLGGATVIVVEVTAQDQMTVKTYSIAVDHDISGELSELKIGTPVTQTTVDVSAEDKRYALEVGYTVESIKLTPRAAEGATINLGVGDAAAQVVVSGEAQTIPLPLGETTLIRIEVEGSAESTTYLLSVFRSTAAVLSELALSVGDLDFTAEVEAYTVAVANTVTTVAVMTATALDSQAMVEIYHGTDQVNVGTPVELAEGATTELRIEVMLGGMMRTYTVSVTRAPSANVDLAWPDGLVLTGATLQPEFAPTTIVYGAVVVAVDSVVVSAKAAHRGATIVVHKDSTEVEADNSEDYVIELTLGGVTTITIVVTAQDEITKRGYLISVLHEISSELSELELEIEEGTTQTLDVAAEDKRYALEVGYTVESIKLTPRAAEGATINLGVGDTAAQIVVSGEAQTIPLLLGETTLIRIEVEGSAENRIYLESTTYLLSVFRSTAAVLSELALSVGDLDFSAEVDAYTVAVANTVTTVAVITATALDSRAMVAIYHGTDQVNVGTPVELAEGATTELRIEVVLGDLMRTYTVSVMRAPSANVDLAELVLTGATLQPPFSSMQVLYTAVAVAVDSVVVSAKAAHRGATIVVRKDSTEVEADNSEDYVIELTLGGVTTITIVVTAQDEITKRRYLIVVLHEIGSELSELELEIEEGTTQTLDVAAEDKRYALEVGYTVESIKLTPRAAEGATINLGVGDTTTKVVVSGEAQTIPLLLGETTLIRIEVEGSAENRIYLESTTYLLSVFRSTAAVLSELALSVGDLDFTAEVEAYTVAVANTVTTVAVMTATALDSQAMVEIYHGTDRVDLGTPVELAEGATTELRIEVVLGDLMRTYRVSVMRAPSANADLAEGDGLVLMGATLQPILIR